VVPAVHAANRSYRCLFPGDRLAARARDLESLSASAIRHRRLYRALARGDAGAKPFDGLRAGPQCARATGFLACRTRSSSTGGLGAGTHAARVWLWRSPRTAAGCYGCAVAPHHTAVAREHPSHRHFRRACDPGAPSPGVRQWLPAPLRAIRLDRAHRILGRDARRDFRGAGDARRRRRAHLGDFSHRLGRRNRAWRGRPCARRTAARRCELCRGRAARLDPRRAGTPIRPYAARWHRRALPRRPLPRPAAQAVRLPS